MAEIWASALVSPLRFMEMLSGSSRWTWSVFLIMEAFEREQPTPPLDANRLVSQRTPSLQQRCFKSKLLLRHKPRAWGRCFGKWSVLGGPVHLQGLNCPVLLPLHVALQQSLMFNYFLLSCDSLSSKQWEGKSLQSPCPPCLGNHSSALSSLYPAGCWSVWPVTFRWPVGSSASFSVEIRGWQRTWNSACILPGTVCLLPESRGVSW